MWLLLVGWGLPSKHQPAPALGSSPWHFRCYEALCPSAQSTSQTLPQGLVDEAELVKSHCEQAEALLYPGIWDSPGSMGCCGSGPRSGLHPPSLPHCLPPNGQIEHVGGGWAGTLWEGQRKDELTGEVEGAASRKVQSHLPRHRALWPHGHLPSARPLPRMLCMWDPHPCPLGCRRLGVFSEGGERRREQLSEEGGRERLCVLGATKEKAELRWQRGQWVPRAPRRHHPGWSLQAWPPLWERAPPGRHRSALCRRSVLFHQGQQVPTRPPPGPLHSFRSPALPRFLFPPVTTLGLKDTRIWHPRDATCLPGRVLAPNALS